ncbi:peptidoglycan DD-metalloendopeptidase family protein [Fictibacillus sp. NRS-1165]|uniref:peptidoglycan DD-metalloendopeptidase family protein n=1 Tax=Fictibacillus sp. NRS-1165 TaxID=3144463 RepID=UPI003D2443DA
MKDEEKQSQKTVPLKSRKMGRFMKKRWVYPAVYLAFAAVVLASVLWYQNDASNSKDEPNSAFDKNDKAVPVSVSKEVFKMPAKDPNSVAIKKEFFDPDASAKEQEAALVFYNNIYYQNKGIDLAAESGKTFDVTAAMSGNVTKSVKDPELGYVVEVEHTNGLITHYSSLASVKVKEGDRVNQGEVVGSAGQNLYDKDAKIHAHFEIRKDGIAVDPVSAWNQSASQIEKLVDKEEQASKKEDRASVEQSKSDSVQDSNAAPEKNKEKESSSTSENSEQSSSNDN